MNSKARAIVTFCASVACFASVSAADVVTVDYSIDSGGINGNDLNGMSASAVFETIGNTLNVTLINTSTGVPIGAQAADSLLVSVGFNLPDTVSIVSGDSAVIGAGSTGIGAWSGLGAGDSVAEEWLWTNEGGGDIMAALDQIISTSSGQGGGTLTDFNGNSASVNGPFGGIAASPPHVNIPGGQPAVSDSIEFSLTLSDTISLDELEAMVAGSMVEFGSNFQYLTVPGPGGLAMLAVFAAGGRRRRRC